MANEHKNEAGVATFCRGIEEYLSADGSDRFAHHLAHVSPEPWLIVETAYLVNRTPGSILPGWHAEVERHKVDITLKPSEVEDSGRRLVLEFKLIHPEWWDWAGVCKDLWGQLGSNKPLADASICFLFQIPLDSWRRMLYRSPVSSGRRSETQEKYDSEFRNIESLSVGAPYALQPSRGEKRIAKVVYRGQVRRASWLNLPVVPWLLLALERSEN